MPVPLRSKCTSVLSALLCGFLFVQHATAAPNANAYARRIAALIDPSKLSTLRERGANSRVQKVVYWLATARAHGDAPQEVLEAAVALSGNTGGAAALTRDALLRNLRIAESLGCLDSPGLTEMRRGNAPTVRKGPYAGDQLSVDHIIPRAVAPEIDNVIANLELMPLRLNQRKNDRIGDRQRDLAKKLHNAGLLSRKGLAAVLQR